MTRKALFLALLAFFVGFEVGFAQNVGNELEPEADASNTRVGTRGANFLEIGVGARAMGTMGAGATLQPGVMSMYWNPAAMAMVEGFGAGISYVALYDDLDIDYFYAGGMIQFLGGMVGVNWGSLSSGDITRTTEDYPNGGDPVFGNTFSWTSSFVGGYYARAITDRLNLGAGLKFISEGITEAKASYVAFDAGITFRTGLWGVELGAVAQNIGSDGEFSGSGTSRIVDSGDQLFAPINRDLGVLFDTRKQELPSLFRFTAKLDIMGSPESLVQMTSQNSQLSFSVDLMDAVDTDVQTILGLEYGFREIAFLRIGKKFFNEDQRTGGIQAQVGGSNSDFRQADFRDFSYGMAFGGGLRLPALGRNLAFDYAYVDFGELQNVQTFSFELGL